MWVRSENQVEFILIRHGSTTMNEEHRYLGKTDVALSEKGVCEIENILLRHDKFLADNNKLSVFTGPMRRCKQTAELIFPGETAIEVPEWTEIDFGDFEGKTYEELASNEDYQRWIDSGGELPFPNGEDRESFIKRSRLGFQRVVSAIKGGNNGCVYAVMHGGNIMAIMSSLCGGNYFDYQVKPVCGYRLLLEIYPEIRVVEIEELK